MPITAPLHNNFNDKHEGNVTITEESFTLYGMIVGDVTVCNGGEFICYGMVVGNVNTDASSSVKIHGTVTKSVIGDGEINIFGTVKNSG